MGTFQALLASNCIPLSYSEGVYPEFVSSGGSWDRVTIRVIFLAMVSLLGVEGFTNPPTSCQQVEPLKAKVWLLYLGQSGRRGQTLPSIMLNIHHMDHPLSISSNSKTPSSQGFIITGSTHTLLHFITDSQLYYHIFYHHITRSQSPLHTSINTSQKIEMTCIRICIKLNNMIHTVSIQASSYSICS